MNIFYVVEDCGAKTQIKESELREYFGKCVVHVIYRCYHCGDIANKGGVVVHKETCKVGADQRLNAALWMVDNLKNHILSNDIATPRVMEYLSEFEAIYK
jgi:hypothetical protein